MVRCVRHGHRDQRCRGGAAHPHVRGESPYALEADATTDALAADSVEAPQITLEETLATARTLDRWRAAIGLRFPFEAETADIPTVSGRPLSVASDTPMLFGEIPGVGKRMSRLVIGVDNQPDLAHASAIFDAFVEQGGTAFDTGYIYGDGEMEGRLGRWIRNRGIREDVVVITKGAHTPTAIRSRSPGSCSRASSGRAPTTPTST